VSFSSSISTLLILVLVISWLKFVPLDPYGRAGGVGCPHDHHYAREFIKKIPKRAIVVTHVRTMFLLWEQNPIQAYAGLNHPDIIRDLMTRYRGDVYFHQSCWCNALNDANRTICDVIRQHYNLESVAVVREQTHEYGLYRMTFY
jgi:hypothetical protein